MKIINCYGEYWLYVQATDRDIGQFATSAEAQDALYAIEEAAL